MNTLRELAQLWGDGLILASGDERWQADGQARPAESDTWVVLAAPDVFGAPAFERLLSLAAAERPDVSIFYGDDAALGQKGVGRVRLKPSFDLALLAADDYIGPCLIVRAAALRTLGGPRAEMGEAALYDLVLRAAAAGLVVERIPHVLVAYAGARPRIPADARQRALDGWIGQEPLEVAQGRTPESLQLRRRFDSFPAVTLVVPTRQAGPPERPYVVELLDSLKVLDWPMERLEVLIGDDSAAAERLPQDGWPFRVTRVATPRAAGERFSYAAKMNRLWRMAQTEHLVLLNDDVTVRSPGWLKALMTFAMEPDVGGVGGRLLFPDGRVQHAGMAGGLFGGVHHLWAGQAGDAPTYQDWALVHREWSMVTGAVFATRRSVMEAAAGFDERFSLEYNDVDLCLRLRLMGYRIVYTPFAEAVHREMASRGRAPAAAEQTALFLSRWRAFLADDPAYHPALSRTANGPEPAHEPGWWDRG